MLALSTLLLVRGLDDGSYTAARSTAAGAVTIDLADASTAAHRPAARRVAVREARAIAAAGRGVHIRIADMRSGESEADLAAVVGSSIEAIVLSAAEIAQDMRDADVGIRQHETRLGIEPGTIRLIPEIDSAAGLLALPQLLAAIDRNAAVALNIEPLTATAPALAGHAMASVAVAAGAADLPWLLAAPSADAGSRSAFATKARSLGAGGVYVASEAEVRGFNDLFAPPRERIDAAREIVAAWDEVRAAGRWSASVNGTLVDRRVARRARALLALDAAQRRRARAR